MATEKPDTLSTSTNSAVPGKGVEAQFSNRFFAYASSGIMRIVFGDSTAGEEPTYHSAVVLELSDAKELVGLLSGLIAQVDAASAPPER